MGCPYCYARRMYDRFKWDKTIRFDPKPLRDLIVIRQPSRIFIGSTMELFGSWIQDEWMKTILHTVKKCSWHTFIFLTKQPLHLSKWNPWPDNCYVGATATDNGSFEQALVHLHWVDAQIKFISLEPFLLPVYGEFLRCLNLHPVDWLIIGAQTNPSRPPKAEWVRDIVAFADKLGIPVFEKNNLRSVCGDKLRQEFP